MSQVIVPSNTGPSPSIGHRGVPFIGVQDWDPRLNFGDAAMSIVAVFSGAGSAVGGPVMPTVGGADRFGMPMCVFGEMPSQGTPSAPAANCPRNGWGLWLSTASLNFWIFNNCPGTNDPPVATYRLVRLTAFDSNATAGAWHRICITKAAGAVGDASFLAYANGAVTARTQLGSCNTIGDVDRFAKMRWFHSVDSFARVVAVSAVAAGIWIYNRELTPAEAMNVTKLPGASGQIDPEDASLVGALVARSYSGAGDWKAIGDRATPRHIVY